MKKICYRAYTVPPSQRGEASTVKTATKKEQTTEEEKQLYPRSLFFLV